MYRIVTQNRCVYCIKAKQLMNENDIEYREHSLTGSPFLKEEMKRMGYKTVPQIWNHRGEHIGGYDDLVKYFERTILSETK